jgi:hypothetical protein
MTDGSPDDLHPFIPARMDDYGLTLAQCRIVVRVARRGLCYESVEKMAKGCRMEVKTCKRALKHLVSIGVLTKDKRPGKSTLYRLVPVNRWPEAKLATIQPSPKGTPGADWPVPKAPVRSPKRHPVRLVQSAPPEGNPSEGSPLKAAPSRSVQAVLDDRELERIEKRIDEIKGQASHDAWGAHYDEKQKAERKELFAKKKLLMERLGYVI